MYNGRGWSISNYIMYKNCPKAYRFALTAKSHNTHLTSLKFLVGTAVHMGISSFIDKWSTSVFQSETATKEVVNQYFESIRKNRETVLVECLNGNEVKIEAIDKLAYVSNKLMSNFFSYVWPRFSHHKYITHEKTRSFLLAGRPVYVKPDLVTINTNGKTVISDWKTGNTVDSEMQNLQISTYALWASEMLHVEPSNVITQVVNLRSGRIDQNHIDESKIESISSSIAQFIEELDTRTIEDDFDANPSAYNCRSCIFLQNCDSGKLTVYDRPS